MRITTNPTHAPDASAPVEYRLETHRHTPKNHHLTISILWYPMAETLEEIQLHLTEDDCHRIIEAMK